MEPDFEKDLQRKDTLFGRKHTLVKYDRHVEVHRSLSSRRNTKVTKNRSIWARFFLVTACIPPFMMQCCGIKGKGPVQAWREKVALCLIIAAISAFVLFFLLSYNDISCPASEISGFVPVNLVGGIIVRGIMYNADNATPPFNTVLRPPGSPPGLDVTQMFTNPSSASCAGMNDPFATLPQSCEITNTCLDYNELLKPNGGIYGLQPYTKLGDTPVTPRVEYDWSDIVTRNLTAYRYEIIDLQRYVANTPIQLQNKLDTLLRQAAKLNDATLLFATNKDVMTPKALRCLSDKYYAGDVLLLPVQCIIARMLTNITLFIVLAVVLTRFFMAITFAWIISKKLSSTPTKSLASKAYNSVATLNSNSFDLHTVFLVTCYSEGDESLRTTFDSLVNTTYPDDKKLLFIVSDGLIVGKGNSKSTPDLIIDMLTLQSVDPIACSYFAVASGSKMHNKAKVYAGFYDLNGHHVPTVLIVKCGTPDEQHRAQKPGNRGKRDSQLILMNFFSRVTTNDYMTPLDFDLFTKITSIANVTPDAYEIVLMVDADTCVRPDALRYMINAMVNDPLVIGLCGETEISNKTESWVTYIQYYISHHLGKAFESVFGGVTCLPGCFCMYRMKAKKNSKWIQLLVHPDIIDIYSTCEVETLHDKNLLLLGEDRFLSTMILSTFVKRKMVFVPQATCETIVPSDFKTLLSQRRRWINSTIHNLMELFQVKNLCGTFCFSMQFIVVMGTAILPVGMLLTYYLIIKAMISTYPNISSYIPTIILIFVIFMPAVLMMLTKPRLTTLGFMLIYVASLPVWNFFLPLYSFWHFDDFSWGATRVIEGGGKEGHGGDGGAFDRTLIPMKRWREYDAERRLVE